MFRTRTQTANHRRGIVNRLSRWSRSKLYLQSLEDRNVPATITVTGAGDAVQVDGLVTLREAIQSINGGANINADVVAVVAPNPYGTADAIGFGPLFSSAQTITMNSSLAQMTISKSVSITGPGVANLTIDANAGTATASSRIFNITGTGTLAVSIAGMTLTGGNVLTGSNGGAILMADEALTLTNVLLTGNKAGTSGGAIATTASMASIAISNSTVSLNQSTGAGGGVIFTPTVSATTVTLTNSTFSGNSAKATGGGVLFGTVSTTLNVSGSTFSANTAVGTSGCFSLPGLSTVTINSSSFNANTATTNAAVMQCANAGSTTIGTSTFTMNSATGSGGVLRFTGVHQATVGDSTFTSNTTGSEGAVFAAETSGTNSTWTNCQFANNVATSRGGVGLMTTNVVGTFTGCTFTQNSSNGDRGGVFYTGGVTLTLNSSSFTQNTTTGHGGVVATSATAAASGLAQYNVNDCTFTQNSALGTGSTTTGFGGALSTTNTNAMTINNSLFSGNTAGTFGGAIGGGSSLTLACSLTVSNSTFTLNTATTTGGAISQLSATTSPQNSSLTISDSQFTSNTATTTGGAINVGSTSMTVNITNSTFSKNKSVTAGGAINSATVGLNLSINTSTFTENTATTTGGVINAASSAAQVSIFGSTFSKNMSTTSGGVLHSAATGFNGFVNDSTFSDNTATTAGGAINLGSTSASLTVNGGSKFLRNASTTSTGGAINTASSLTNGTFDDTMFIENRASTGGGALNAASTSAISSQNSSFIDNTAAVGGAIRLVGTSITLNMFGALISGNTATTGAGGGIYSSASTNATTLTFNRSSIVDNTAKAGGGGIRISNATVELNNSTLSGNVSEGDTSITGGGGILQANTSFIGSIKIINSTVTNNSATGVNAFGGGIFGIDSTPTDGTIQLTSSIVAGNLNPNNPSKNQDIGFTVTRDVIVDRVLIGAANPSFTFAVVNLNPALVGTESVVVDPGLYRLYDHGGTGAPLTHGLRFNSLAIDQGNDGLVTTIDQRGFPRPVDDPGFINAADGTDLGSTEGPVLHPVPQIVSFDGTIDGTNVGQTTFVVTVVYQDNSSVNSLSIGTGDIALYRGTSLTPIFPTSFLTTPTAGSVTATYTFTPPDGSWELSDNDTYTLKMLADEVNDGNVLNTAFPGALGKVVVSIPAFYQVSSLADEDDMDYSFGDFTLREAIRRANTEGLNTQDVIQFHSSLIGQTIVLGSPLVVSDPIFIDGPDGNNVTISGNSAVQIFSFTIPGAGAQSKFEYITLTKGNATGTLSGGAISLVDDELTLTNVTINESVAGGDGGAVNLTTGKLVVNSSLIANNRAGDTGGGLSVTTGTIQVSNSLISGNFAVDAGGGVYLTSGSLTVTGSTIRDNRTNTGTGAGIDASTGSVVVTNSTISGNSAQTRGGGIYLTSGSLLVQSSTLSNNIARSLGGGGLSATTGSVTLINSTISGNSTDFFTTKGGGIYLSGATVTLNVFNSTITNNATKAGGGGIAIGGSTSTVANVVLESSIVAQNTGGADPDIFTGAADTTSFSITGTKNVIGALTDVQITLADPVNNQFGNSTLALNAKLTPLGSYGAATQTHGLLLGSPAINMGTIAGNPTLTLDQKGLPRNDGGGVDAGSTEGEYLKPIATANLGDVTIGGGTTYVATVVYTDPSGVDSTTVNGTEVTLNRPGLAPISPFMTNKIASGGSVTATYTFAVPTTNWDITDNGIFSLNLKGGTVSDGANAVDAAVIGTFEVNVPKTYLVDKFDVDADDGLYGPGQLTLREAISRAAIENPGFNDIITFSGTTIKLSGEITITDRVTIIGNGPAVTRIEGTGVAAPTNRLFNINIPGGAKTVSFNNLTLANGHAGTANGGAINSDDDHLTITNVTFDNNRGTDGGAINMQLAGTKLTINSSTFTGNIASSTGGALSTIGYSQVSITNSSFGDNSATAGGGFYGVSTVTLNVTNSKFTNNIGSTSTGGAINTAVPANVSVSGSLFSGNTATGGGAINIASTGQVSIVNSTLMNNTATSTGGGGLRSASTTTVIDIRNSTISGNVSNGSTSITGGGGIILTSTAFTGALNIYNSTIFNNSSPNAATKGGGIFVNDDTGTILLSSTILAGNNNTLAPDISANGTLPRVVTVDYSLIGSIDAVSTFSLFGTHNPALIGTASTIDPMLLPLAATYGGNVFVHAIAVGSPVVDQGVNATGLTTDQRGVGRTLDVAAANAADGTDIGSTEGELRNPIASANLADFKGVGQTKFSVDVLYNDETELDFTEFGTGDVALYRKNAGSPIVPTGFTVSLIDIQNAKVTYEFTAPGDGIWDFTDNDSYTLRLLDNQVYDKDLPSKNAAIGGELDSFELLIPTVFLVDNAGNDDDGNYGAGQLTLREAIGLSASLNSGVTDSITFAGSLNGKTISLTKEITITDSVIIQGPGAFKLTIKGAAVAAADNRVFNINVTAGPNVVSISGLTLQNGNLSAGNGGAILSADETLNLTDMVFQNNRTAAAGGAVATSAANAVLNITGSRFFENVATTTGGAVNTAGATTTVSIANSYFRGNGATTQGGAVNFASSTTLSISNSTFELNVSTSSGGAVNIGSTTTGSIVGSSFFNNRGTAGGAIRVAGTSTLTFDGSVISGNTAATATGGGLYFSATTGEITVRNSSITNNTAATGGGGIRMVNQNMTIVNTTISGNVSRGTTAITGGAGIIITSTSFTNSLKIYNSTIANNSSPGALTKGGGIFVNDDTGTILISGSILAGNLNALAPDISATVSTITLNRPLTIISSLVGTVDQFDFDLSSGNFNPALVGIAPAVVNPQIHPLAYYGGPTQTHILKTGSPAIDQSNNDSTPTLTTDQRGFTRPVDDPMIINVLDGSDIGAVEGPLNFPTTSTALADVANPGAAIYVAQVTFSDALGINAATIGNSDVLLSGLGYPLSISPTSTNIISNTGTSVTVNYTFDAPGLSWDYTDNGLYTLSMVKNEVKNAGGLAAAEGTLGTFRGLVPITFNVDKLGDIDDANYGVGELTIREALLLASTTNYGFANKITFSAALMGKTITLSGTELTVTRPITIEGLGSGNLTIDGAGLSRIFNITTVGNIPTTISGLKLTGGNAGAANGGAINMAQPDTLNLVDCNIFGNIANIGGGVNFSGTVSTGNFTLTSFTNNTATGGQGGGVAFTGNSTTTINSSTFTNNIATTGGALFISGTNQVTANNTKFIGNKATSTTGGGAIRNGGGTMTFNDSLFDSNQSAGFGGAIGDDGGPAHNVFSNNTTFKNNVATQGGAIYLDEGIITATGSTFSGNIAKTGFGGAIAFNATGTVGSGVRLTNTTFADNQAATSGGAIHIASQASGNDGFLAFKSEGSTFAGNLALGGAGGAVHMGRGTISIDTTSFIRNRSQASGGGFSSTSGPNHYTISNSLFEGNEGLQDGGGLIAASTSDLVMTNTIFRNNTTSRAGGGAFVQGVGSVWTINDSTFEGNRAGEGGGFGNDDRDSTVTFNRTTFANNTARVGGGIGIGADATAASSAGYYVLNNTTLSGNVATSDVLGGGAISIHNFLWAGTLDIRNSTITGNKAVNGGGILGIAPTDVISITSSIIAGNSASTKGRDFAFIVPRPLNVDGVLIGTLDNSNAALGGTWNLALVGTDIAPVDPGLYPLANNGGPTKTHALRVGSKALDAGNDNFSLGVDQRGVTRTVPHDLGSFEGTLLTPMASFALANVPPASADYVATIVYEDDISVNLASIDPTDVVINGKAFAPNSAPYKVVTTGGGGKVTADYYFTPPGGWDNSDNGIYSITLVGDVNDGTNSVIKNQTSTFRVGFATTFKVDITNDEDDGNYGVGDLSLREAIKLANGSREGSVDTITFDPIVFGKAQTIFLTLGQLDITDSVVVNGPGMGLLTIDAIASSRHFEFNGDGIIDVAMSGMKLVNGNTTFFRDGGSVRIYYANATFTGMHFDSNKATEDGGAIYVLGSTVKVSIIDSKVTNNFAGTFGGGMGAHAAANFNVVRSTISGNSSNNNGGGIYFQYNGSLTLDRSTVSNNTAELVTPKLGGGGIYFYGVVDGGGFNITNSTISGNKASKTHGGGISIAYLTGAVTIRNSTITGNDAVQSGGGISHRYNVLGVSTITLDSTIVAGNKQNGFEIAATADLNSDAAFNIGGNNNLIGIMDATNNVTLTGMDNKVGDQFAKLDALLGPLQDNGGPTFTHALLPGSPAINAGSNPSSLTTDQRGYKRDVGQIDIGAYEVQPPRLNAVVIDDGSGQRSLVRSIHVTFSEPVTFPDGLAAAFDVSRYDKGAPGSVMLSFVHSGADVTITFTTGGSVGIDPNNSLEDGKYRLTIHASKVSGNGGTLDGDGDYVSEGSPADDRIAEFHRLFGDGNGDGSVTAFDFNTFRLSYGSFGPSIFDFNGDNQVSASDFNQFRTRYGVTFVP